LKIDGSRFVDGEDFFFFFGEKVSMVMRMRRRSELFEMWVVVVVERVDAGLGLDIDGGVDDIVDVGVDGLLPGGEEDLWPLAQSQQDEEQDDGGEGRQGDEGGCDSGLGGGDAARAGVREGHASASKTAGAVAEADAADIIGGLGGRDAVTAVARGGVASADAALVDREGADGAVLPHAASASIALAAPDAASVPEARAARQAVATLEASVSIAHTADVKMVTLEAGAGVYHVIDGDLTGDAFAVVERVDAALHGTGDVGARVALANARVRVP